MTILKMDYTEEEQARIDEAIKRPSDIKGIAKSDPEYWEARGAEAGKRVSDTIYRILADRILNAASKQGTLIYGK